MTRGAARELLDLIFRDEPASELHLICRRLIIDAEHVLPRADKALRIAVALEAPFHLQRALLPHERHPIDLPVTGGAPDALVHMDAVIEEHEVWEIVDARPTNRCVSGEAGANRLQVRAIGEDLRVAVHARLGRRDPGETGLFDRRVAIAAVDTVAGHVALVAELDGLLSRDARFGD